MKRLVFLLAAGLLCGAEVPAQTIPSSTVCSLGGGGSVSPGSTPLTGCTNAVLYGDGSAVLGCESALSYNATTNAFGVSGPTTVSSMNAGSTLGSDIVTNGTFTGNATGWTLGGGGGAPDWAYNSNNVTHANAGGTTALQPSTPLTITNGTIYVVTFTISSWTAGTVTTSIGGVSTTLGTGASTAVGGNGTFKFVIQATGTGNLLFTPTTTFAATFDTVSVTTLTVASPWLTLSDGSVPLHGYFGPAASRNTFFGQQVGQYAASGAANSTCYGGLACSTLITSNSVTALGTSACANCTNASGTTAVGTNACRNLGSGIRNTCVGESALTPSGTTFVNENVGIGYQAGNGNSADYTTCVGSTTCTSNTFAGVIGLGYSAIPTAANQAVIGGSSANSAITAFYLGQGVTKASPGNITWATTGGSGTDNAGSSLTVLPGASTGTGTSALTLGRNLKLATASTAQTQVPGMTFCPRKILSNTSATAQTLAIVDLPSNSAGGGEVSITVTCSDGTNFDSETQTATFSYVNKAGTLTLSTPTITASSAANNSGSCTIGFTITAGTNQVNLRTTPVFTTIVPTTVHAYLDVVTHQGSATAVACQ